MVAAIRSYNDTGCGADEGDSLDEVVDGYDDAIREIGRFMGICGSYLQRLTRFHNCISAFEET